MNYKMLYICEWSKANIIVDNGKMELISKNIETFSKCRNRNRTRIEAAHHVPKCMGCHKSIVVMTGRAHCFYDYIYIMLILLL